jgi:hypothetical protein
MIYRSTAIKHSNSLKEDNNYVETTQTECIIERRVVEMGRCSLFGSGRTPSHRGQGAAVHITLLTMTGEMPEKASAQSWRVLNRANRGRGQRNKKAKRKIKKKKIGGKTVQDIKWKRRSVARAKAKTEKHTCVKKQKERNAEAAAAEV